MLLMSTGGFVMILLVLWRRFRSLLRVRRWGLTLLMLLTQPRFNLRVLRLSQTQLLVTSEAIAIDNSVIANPLAAEQVVSGSDILTETMVLPDKALGVSALPPAC